MLLSILIPGKNDNFYNALHKLNLNLTKTIENITNLNSNNVEVVLCDWGSETKITDALNLKTTDSFRCVYVPPDIAQKYNKDATYSIVHPINTAFRHSHGQYVIFWDSDCFVTQDSFNKLYSFVQKLELEKNLSFFWGSRFNVAHDFYENFNNFEVENKLRTACHSQFYHDKINIDNFSGVAASILMNRQLWEESTGWWEELIYWGWQDIEFHHRLKQKYNFGGDLEDQQIYFYHLCNESTEHHHLYSTRKVNPYVNAPTFKANNDVWGLINEPVIIY